MRPSTIVILFFLFSCGTNSAKTDEEAKDTVNQKVLADTSARTSSDDTGNNLRPTPLVWFVDFDKKTKAKNPNFRQEYLNVDSLISGLNQVHSNIILDKIKVSGDTLFTEIKDSEYLGERIGSYGAFAYIADVVINLTSVKNINFVKIDFEDGSHISQGTWSKKEYSNYKQVD
jgi:hypothetical protein